MRRVLVTGGSGFVGTNLVDYYLHSGVQVISLDVCEPRFQAHRLCWRRVDILDQQSLSSAIAEFEPTEVAHLAARTDLDESCGLIGYRVNTDGFANLLTALRTVPGLRRLFFASSMLVCHVGYRPRSDTDYRPTTTYGESKVLGEKLLRKAPLNELPWVIGRLTSIWGPWFGEPYRRFFELVGKRIYVNPSTSAATKTFGYVENTVHQIDRLLTADSAVEGHTYYLGDDPPLNVAEWADQIATEFGVRHPKRVPLGLLKVASRLGDVAALGGVRFPLTTFRFRNMTTDHVVDVRPIILMAGMSKVSTREGIRRTIKWLQDRH